jgi:ribA/ribD-fused uncharacterized protein
VGKLQAAWDRHKRRCEPRSRGVAWGAVPRDVAELLAAIRTGQRFKYLYFWGHRPEEGGRVGKGCLSQWWPATFEVDGAIFGSAEHYMMWRKATLFGDEATAARIASVAHPSEAKALGRQVKGFDEATWVANRFGIVVAGSRAKFEQNLPLLGFLMGTAGRVLVEASPQDRVWGIGLSATDPRTADPARWPGINLLGFALMQARTDLAGAQ